MTQDTTQLSLYSEPHGLTLSALLLCLHKHWSNHCWHCLCQQWHCQTDLFERCRRGVLTVCSAASLVSAVRLFFTLVSAVSASHGVMLLTLTFTLVSAMWLVLTRVSAVSHGIVVSAVSMSNCALSCSMSAVCDKSSLSSLMPCCPTTAGCSAMKVVRCCDVIGCCCNSASIAASVCCWSCHTHTHTHTHNINVNKTVLHWRQTTCEQDTQTLFVPVTLTLTRWPWSTNVI